MSLWITCMSAELENGCDVPCPTVRVCPRTRMGTFSYSVYTPGTQWRGHTIHQCPRLCEQSDKVLPLLVYAGCIVGGHRQKEMTTFSVASTRTGAGKKRCPMKQGAECSSKQAEEDATTALIVTQVLASQFVGWSWTASFQSTPVGNVGAVASSELEALVLNLLLPQKEWDQYRPLREQEQTEEWLFQLFCHKCSKKHVKQYFWNSTVINYTAFRNDSEEQSTRDKKKITGMEGTWKKQHAVSKKDY